MDLLKLINCMPRKKQIAKGTKTIGTHRGEYIMLTKNEHFEHIFATSFA